MGRFRMISLKNIFSRFTSMVTLVVLIATALVVVDGDTPARASVTITKNFAGSTWSLVAGYHAANQSAAAANDGIKSLFTTPQNNNLSSLSAVLATTGSHYSNSALYNQMNNGYLLEGYTDAGAERNIKAIINTANHTWSDFGNSTVQTNYTPPFAISSTQLYNSAGATLTTTFGYLSASSGTSSPMDFSNDSGDYIMMGAHNGSRSGGDSFDVTFNGSSNAIGIGMSDGTGTGSIIKNSFSVRGNAMAITINDGASGSGSHSGNTSTGWVMVWVRGAGPVATVAPAISPANSGLVGATYTATNGTWTGTGTVTDVSARWQISSDNNTWADIPGATSSTYTTVASDAGKYLRWAVTKSDTNGSTTVGSSSTQQITTTPIFTAATPPSTSTLNSALSSYTFAASGFRVTYSVASGQLPTGITLNSSSGVLSGTPTSSGVFTYTVSATNDSGTTTTGAQTLSVNQAPSWTANAPTLSMLTGTSYTYTFTATGYPAPTFSVTSGTLPAGMTLVSSTGVLSGTPTTVGSSTVTFSASNGIGTAASISRTFSVTAGVQATLYANASNTTLTYDAANQPTATLSTTGGSGTGSVTYVVQAGSGSVCSLSGTTVTALTAGSCTIVATKASDANYGSTTATVTIVINKASQSALIAQVSNDSFTYSATTQTATLSTTGGNGTGAVTYAVAAGSTSVCSVSGTTVSILTAGSCLVNATKAADTNYLVQTSSVSINIARANQGTLTSTAASPSLNYNASSTPTTLLSTSGGSGSGVVSYAIAAGSLGICSVSGSTVSAITAGTCLVTATKAADTNYLAQTTQVSITINRISQSALNIQAGTTSLNYHPTNAPTTTLSANGGSGTGSITFAVAESSSEICSIDGVTVIAITAGSCVIEAAKSGDVNYLERTASLTITINKIAQANFEISASVSEITYSEQPASSTEFSVIGGSGEGTVSVTVAPSSATVCSIEGSTVVALTAGSCVLNASKTSDTNYLIATDSVTITVSKATQTELSLNASNRSITLTSANPTSTLSFTGGSGTGAAAWSIDPASSGICSLSGNTVTALAVGDCIVVLTKSADTNYLVATRTLRITVAAALQAAVSLTASVTNLTIDAEELSIATVTFTGGTGSGLVSFESLTPTLCVIGSGRLVESGVAATVVALHAGTCSVRAVKAGDGNFAPAETDAVTIVVAKGTQSDLLVTLENQLTYTSNPLASSRLITSGGNGAGTVSYTLVSGACTLTANELVANSAGDCVVRATKASDQDFNVKSVDTTFTIAKATQSLLTVSLAADAPGTIAWDGKRNTTLEVAGGSGTGAISVATNSADICTAAIVEGAIRVTGVSAGSCEVTVTKATSTNYLARSASINVSVIDLPTAPTSVEIVNTGVMTDDGTAVTISWTAEASSGTQAEVTGYEVQYKSGLNWITADGGLVDADVRSITVYPTPWTALFIRVAPVSNFDDPVIQRTNWTNYTGTSEGTAPVAFNIAGALVNLSSPMVAATSGEVVFLTGTDFDQSTTNKVRISTGTSVNSSSIGRVNVTNTIDVPAVVVSPTRLSFLMPKVKIPTGQTQLASTVRVLSTSGVLSEPLSFNFIPKKLAQTVSLAGLPAGNVLVVGTPINGTLAPLGAIPTVAATAGICSATISENGAVEISPLAKGACTVTISAPATPGYSAAAPKVFKYTVAGQSHAVTFADPADRPWSAAPMNLTATSDRNLPVVFTTDTSAICSVSGSTLTMLKAGVCTIRASSVGTSSIEAALPITQSFTITKANRTTGFAVTTNSVAEDGTETPVTLDGSSLTASVANVSVAIGLDPVDVPVTLSARQGTVLFTVAPADDSAGRCVADSGVEDSLEGVITLTNLGSCKVTIIQPADDRFNAGESVVVWINAVARTGEPEEPEQDRGDGEAAEEDTDSNVADPDSETAVAINLSSAGGTFDFGGQVGLNYDPVKGLLTMNTRTMFVGTFRVVMTSPDASKKWFRVQTIVKKKKVMVDSNACTLTLAVKKDAKLKKSVLRTIGSGCTLSVSGKAALTESTIQKIKIAYVFNRAYAKTGLNFQGTSRNKVRILAKVKRTLVLKVGSAN